MRGKQPCELGGVGEGGITPADAGKTIKQDNGLICAQDHPRGCGENSFSIFPFFATLGSPPRMRGKPTLARLAGKRFGITPADAGKTWFGEDIPGGHEDHPRGCGENPHERLQEAVDYGSPPRMRGKPLYGL